MTRTAPLRHSDLSKAISRKSTRFTYEEQFWTWVAYLGASDHECWNWTGSMDGGPRGDRYGKWRGHKVHRFAYQVTKGPIPEGMVIDHLCDNTRCCNPAHLVATTNKANVLRGNGPTALNARKTVCSNGHPLTEDNVYVRKGGGRRCKVCHPAKDREIRSRR